MEVIRVQSPNWLKATQNLGLAVAVLLSLTAAAEAADTAAPGNTTSVELNKLEVYEKGCRAYVVVNNATETSYQTLKLDLVLFQTDGVIGRRFALDLAPLKPQKKSVKLFELDGAPCDKIGSFLVNDILDCKADTGPIADCAKQISTSSLTSVKFSK